MNRPISEIIVHIVLMGLVGYFLMESLSIRGSAAGGSLSPAFFPKTICILLLVFLTFSLSIKIRMMVVDKSGERSLGASREVLVSVISWVAVFLELVVYAMLLESFGYILSTTLLIFSIVSTLVLLSAQSERKISSSNIARLGAFSLSVSVSIFFIFSKGFGIRLPTLGIMGV
nr:tripartite tricarboxylate transporter TctB family protein [Halomonas socia]